MREFQTTTRPAESASEALLEEFMRAAGDADRDRALMRLLDEIAEPAARRIIRQKLRDEENADDLWQEISVQLIVKLAETRRAPDEHPIANFRAYAAVTAYRVCADFLRRKYPQRFSLCNKIRYLLSRDPDFEIWEPESGRLLGGLRGWSSRFRDFRKNEDYRKILDAPVDFFSRISTIGNFAAESLPRLVRAVFELAAVPFELDDLTSVIADLQGVKDRPPAEIDGDDDDGALALADPRGGVLDDLTSREYLRRLWAEIQDLPVRQRAALLLNLRDASGGNALEIFPVAGSVSPKELAAALEMSHAEFLEIWNELPFDDRRIAEFLGATRQQVINLRKCAREKLGRRLK